MQSIRGNMDSANHESKSLVYRQLLGTGKIITRCMSMEFAGAAHIHTVPILNTTMTFAREMPCSYHYIAPQLGAVHLMISKTRNTRQ